MKIFHCAANSGLLSCLPMVYPACCPCSSSLSAENCGGGLLPLGSNSTIDGYIPTAVSAAVVQSVRPISNPTTETPPTTPDATRPNEETTPAAPETNRPDEETVPATPETNRPNEETPPTTPDATRPNEETVPTTPETARPNEEATPSAPIRPVSAFRLPEDGKEPATAGSAAQFWIRDSQAINASVLHLFPQTVAGQDLAFSEDTLSLAPNGVYFVSFLLKAQANGKFVEVIPQIDLALHHEFSACAKGDSSQEPQADAVSLSCGFLVNTTACTAPTSLQFLLHTDSAQPIAVNGCLSLFKIGVPFGD
ncbi:MAG: hypothetical protein U0M41_07000 [Negativibacillus sp.]|nr:hypothetical protein [Clostridium sp.]MEE0783568.1 hypothetical protein [Negativibacillus sp.]